MRSSITLLVLLGFASATPTSFYGPVVTIQNGTLVGRTNNSVDSFIGIPYVKPPINDLRLRPPQSIDEPFGTLRLPEIATACLQQRISRVDTTGIPPEGLAALEGVGGSSAEPSSEDCLSLSVQRPANIHTDQKLPVLVWIHGGAWAIGATQWYDGANVIRKSMNMSEPIIFVAINYRLNAFGFLHGRELQAEGSTNLGLRDQRKALEWVAENIEAFGGDPDKVTIWGESAGAASVFDHLTINNGNHTYNDKPLFRAGIMNSGTNIRTLPTDSSKAQAVFNKFATAAGCESTDNGENTLACLRSASSETLADAVQTLDNFNGPRSNDVDFIRRPDPSSDFYSQFGDEAIARGSYARVPLIAGSLEDESTVFSVAQRNIINSSQTLVEYIASWFPEADHQTVEDLVRTYSDDPAAGLPAHTGSEYELYPQFKRLATIQSDLTFSQARRGIFSQMCGEVPLWGFLGTFLQGLPQFGTYHTADLATQFSLRVNTFAGHAMDAAFIHFVNYLDPNGNADAPPWWPQWNNEEMLLANFSATELGLTKDNFRSESYQFIQEHGTELRQ